MNQNNKIDPSTLNIYGINAFINKFDDSKQDIINLQELKETFKVDFKFDDKTNQIQETNLPAFTQLTYNERVVSDDTSYPTSYNRPPLGPIENFCYCSYCSNTAPEYHKIECPFPEKKSLFLTFEGLYNYVIKSTKTDFSNNLIEFKQSWLDNELTQEQLNEFLLIPNSVKINVKKSNDNSNNNIFINDKNKNKLTKIQYFDVVKLRGPTKLAYTTATEKFSNAIMLSYEYIVTDENDEKISKKTSIRIYKNGLINLINIPNSIEQKNILYNSLIDRINNSSNKTINIVNFNNEVKKFINKDYKKYAIINNASYIHSVNSQFSMWKIKDKYLVDLNKLSDLISPFNLAGKIVSGKYTTVSTLLNSEKQIMKLEYNTDSVNVVNWEHLMGKVTKTQSMSREEIKCVIIPIEGIKISLQIHKHGTFQMSMSYCSVSDLKNSICSEIINKIDFPLNFEYFKIVKNIFTGIFKDTPSIIGSNIEYSEEDTSMVRNTVSGNAPPNKPGTSTAVCRNKDPRPGYPSPRPIPYSFQGQCPETRQYIDPIGVLGNDGLYYPCCSAKTKKSEVEYKDYIINGFPKNTEESKKYGVTSIEDKNSGILKPGSINIGASTRAKINDIWTPVTIIGYKGKSIKHKEILVQLPNTKVVTINRQYLERDSRYFPGLKTLDKDQLIRCIIKNLKYSKNEILPLELENLNTIKNLIAIPNPNFNPILTVYNINIFEEVKYYVTSVPNTSNLYYFYISPSESYFINIFGNKKVKKVKGPLENINETIIFLGFLENNTEKYFVTDILYFNKKIDETFSNKIKILREIQETYFLIEQSIIFSEYSSNIIEGSKELLQENSDISLIFTPNKNYLNIKVWNSLEQENMKKSKDIEITLQIIREQQKTNYFTLGYENNNLNQLTVSFDNIFIPKAFVDKNNVKVNDYILFKFDYNLQTGELGSRILNPLEKTIKPNMTLNETLIKLSLILNPIKESFFINNRYEQDFIWSIPGKDKILKFSSNEGPLVQYSE
jgi:hypothetical protein